MIFANSLFDVNVSMGSGDSRRQRRPIGQDLERSTSSSRSGWPNLFVRHDQPARRKHADLKLVRYQWQRSDSVACTCSMNRLKRLCISVLLALEGEEAKPPPVLTHRLRAASWSHPWSCCRIAHGRSATNVLPDAQPSDKEGNETCCSQRKPPDHETAERRRVLRCAVVHARLSSASI